MPLGKYYCDYCEKQFQDTPAARKRHIEGSQHQRARALWYDAARRQELHGGSAGAPPFVQPPHGAVGVCQHFVRTGTCRYGDSCRYFHPKPGPANLGPAPSGPGSGAMVQQSNFVGSQPNFVGYQAADGFSFSGNILGGHTSWGNLPPSRRPPPEGGPIVQQQSGRSEDARLVELDSIRSFASKLPADRLQAIVSMRPATSLPPHRRRRRSHSASASLDALAVFPTPPTPPSWRR